MFVVKRGRFYWRGGSDGNFFGGLWAVKQSKARRFASRESAGRVAYCVPDGSRVVRLKKQVKR